MPGKLLLLTTFGAFSLCVVGPARADSISTTQNKLVAELQWEILWKDLPSGFRQPNTGSAMFAIERKTRSVAYCSGDIGVCAKYTIDPTRNWLRDSSAACSHDQNSLDCLTAFAGLGRTKPATAEAQHGVSVDADALNVSPAKDGGLTWTATLRFGTRAEIINKYRRMRPVELKGLADWLRTTTPLREGYRSITIPCFASTDPLIYLYGDRLAKAPLIFAAFWDRDEEKWVDAGILVTPGQDSAFGEMRDLIRSLACTIVKFPRPQAGFSPTQAN